jgi:sphingosine kinase
VILDDRKLFSFLSAGWGLLADIDVESEILRAIGEPRFTVWSLLRLMKLKTYRAQLSYIPCSPLGGKSVRKDSLPESDTGDSSERKTIEGDFISIYSSIQSYIGSDLIFAPSATPNDGQIHLTYMRSNAGRACATQFLLALDKGTHANINGVSYVQVKEFSLQSKGGIGGNLVIDGERVSAEKMTVRISPTPLNVFSM